MRFLWKSQLKRERGRFIPQKADGKNALSRRERFEPQEGTSFSFWGTLFLWFLFLGTLVYVLVFSPYLAITSWQAQGLTLVNQERFKESVDQQLHQKYLSFIPRDRYALVRPKALEMFLEERYPLIRNITVARVFPHSLDITVEERDTLLLWCVADACGHVLEDGSVKALSSFYDEEENKARTLVLRDGSAEPLRFGEGVYDPRVVALALSLPQALRDRFAFEVEKEMSFSSRFANELRMKTTAGWELYVSTHLPLEATIDTLRLLFEKELPEEKRNSLMYIDLRTENRVFYRYQDGAQEESVDQKDASEETKKTDEKKDEKKR